MALWAAGDRAVLVVCDGVSSSIDSDVAALAGAEKARDVLAALSSDGIGGESSEEAALASALVTATDEANKAVIAQTAPDSTNAASATFAAAVVVNNRVHYANLGDSRVYLLTASEKVLLTVDDSMAQAFISEGMPRAEAESLPRAHAITKWLGRDAIDTVPRTGHHAVAEPGWLVVCSDGLWNYASSPEELSQQVDAAAAGSADPVEIAGRLVVWANTQGGKDNVTVALARVPAGAPTLGATPSDQEKESPEHG
jgi:serine/threonine protein phosphatase PrpC